MLPPWLVAHLPQLCWCQHNGFCLGEQLGSFHNSPHLQQATDLAQVLLLVTLFVSSYSITSYTGPRHSSQNLACDVGGWGAGSCCRSGSWDFVIQGSCYTGCAPTEESAAIPRTRVPAGAQDLHDNPEQSSLATWAHSKNCFSVMQFPYSTLSR